MFLFINYRDWLKIYYVNEQWAVQLQKAYFLWKFQTMGNCVMLLFKLHKKDTYFISRYDPVKYFLHIQCVKKVYFMFVKSIMVITICNIIRKHDMKYSLQVQRVWLDRIFIRCMKPVMRNTWEISSVNCMAVKCINHFVAKNFVNPNHYSMHHLCQLVPLQIFLLNYHVHCKESPWLMLQIIIACCCKTICTPIMTKVNQ